MLELKYGTIEGIREDDGYVFKGIPYAKPPIGNLRWKPTSSLTEDDYWTDYRKTDQFGSMCMQRNMLTYEAEGSEDCLYINVWTPTVNNRSNLPVMVYIHGGDLVALSGNVPGYSPTTKLAVETNMVHVSFNYRLNAFGYLALESFSRQSESGKSGNYGLWDQLEALRWIQQNIQQFGGNPGHVTVYGHSSGATSVFALLGTSLSN
uniref:Carboxylic ester hydrolase n=1 Tax=Saccoglossus kowalevskii TaxID=10224 RepID=A0ABM0GUH3_SACKO